MGEGRRERGTRVGGRRSPPTSGVDRGVGHGLLYTSSSVVGEQRRICRASRASERASARRESEEGGCRGRWRVGPSPGMIDRVEESVGCSCGAVRRMLKMEGEEEGQGETRRWSRMEVKKWIVTLERPLQPKCQHQSQDFVNSRKVRISRLQI